MRRDTEAERLVNDAGSPAGPVNPLKGRSGRIVDLLETLTDDQLDQYRRYWQSRRELYSAEGDGFAAWKCSNLLSSGCREMRRRGLSPDSLGGDS